MKNTAVHRNTPLLVVRGHMEAATKVAACFVPRPSSNPKDCQIVPMEESIGFLPDDTAIDTQSREAALKTAGSKLVGASVKSLSGINAQTIRSFLSP